MLIGLQSRLVRSFFQNDGRCEQDSSVWAPYIHYKRHIDRLSAFREICQKIVAQQEEIAAQQEEAEKERLKELKMQTNILSAQQTQLEQINDPFGFRLLRKW